MKFGYYVRSVFTYPEIRDLTLKVEKLGFESAHVNDHLIHGALKKDPYLVVDILMIS